VSYDVVLFKYFYERLVAASIGQMKKKRYCPFACRSDTSVCVGRGVGSGKIAVLDYTGFREDMELITVASLVDCPVRRKPNKKTI
jgi:hypothetical protein